MCRFSLNIHTFNVLGKFNDPFEFEGDYGSRMNAVRDRVFSLLVSREALARNGYEGSLAVNSSQASSKEPSFLAASIEADRLHGPKLSDVFSSELMSHVINQSSKLNSLGISSKEIRDIFEFIKKYGNKRVFQLFRQIPGEFLSIDKQLRDRAAAEGKGLDLPIVNSTEKLVGSDIVSIKKDLFDRLFTSQTIGLAKPKASIENAIHKVGDDFLQKFWGHEALSEDLRVFSNPAGQLFFYFLYQSLNLQLICEQPDLIREVNEVKELFEKTIGNSRHAAEALREKLAISNSSVLFSQECDKAAMDALLREQAYLPLDSQMKGDGCYVFLKSDQWEPDYKPISFEDYEGYSKGRINAVLATLKGTQDKFLLASCHGHSRESADGRLQIKLVMDKFRELSAVHKNLQLVIGTDANTKSAEDVDKFRRHLEGLGLIATDSGPTTLKKRMVTVQHDKVGRPAIDEEDYLIVLKPQNGGRYLLDQVTVGFQSKRPDLSQTLPTLNNQSDHFAIGASLRPLGLFQRLLLRMGVPYANRN